MIPLVFMDQFFSKGRKNGAGSTKVKVLGDVLFWTIFSQSILVKSFSNTWIQPDFSRRTFEILSIVGRGWASCVPSRQLGIFVLDNWEYLYLTITTKTSLTFPLYIQYWLQHWLVNMYWLPTMWKSIQWALSNIQKGIIYLSVLISTLQLSREFKRASVIWCTTNMTLKKHIGPSEENSINFS